MELPQNNCRLHLAYRCTYAYALAHTHTRTCTHPRTHQHSHPRFFTLTLRNSLLLASVVQWRIIIIIIIIIIINKGKEKSTSRKTWAKNSCPALLSCSDKVPCPELFQSLSMRELYNSLGTCTSIFTSADRRAQLETGWWAGATEWHVSRSMPH